MNHATTEIFLDGVLRAGRRPRRRGGQGIPLHPRRHERRARPDRGGVHRRRALVRREGDRVRARSGWSSAGRSARTRACSSRSRAPTPQIEAADLVRYKAAWLFEQGLPCGAGGEHGEAARRRGLVGRRRTPASTPTAASASRRSTTSSGSSARRGSTRWRRSRTTSSSPTSASTCSACRGVTSLRDRDPFARIPLRNDPRPHGRGAPLKSPAAFGGGDGALDHEGSQRPLEPLRVEPPADEDEPRAVVVVRPGVQVDRRVDDVLDGVDEQRARRRRRRAGPSRAEISLPRAWRSIVSQTRSRASRPARRGRG